MLRTCAAYQQKHVFVPSVDETTFRMLYQRPVTSIHSQQKDQMPKNQQSHDRCLDIMDWTATLRDDIDVIQQIITNGALQGSKDSLGSISASLNQAQQQSTLSIERQRSYQQDAARNETPMYLKQEENAVAQECSAHQVLRDALPKMQALLDLFAQAYREQNLAKAEDVRKRLNWAIDQDGK
ncbi:hypothetical protein AC579_882 [Pseudocercospora musae]|uniref:Uncharacterized protein n=1 Tax=Pseudocercospora musae TaxID=113226 RepID=A0A139IN69_9PEZI|nr:hypothetical protein AC579_882 [Pseudocercospora musae]